MTYFCQQVEIPSVSLGATEIGTRFVNYPIAGDKMEFGDLTVEFLVDANMDNYKAIFDWLDGLGKPENYQQYIDQVASTISKSEVAASMSDATLTILGANGTPIRSIRFADCFPTTLNSLTFLSTSQDVQYLIGNATFKYSYFNFI